MRSGSPFVMIPMMGPPEPPPPHLDSQVPENIVPARVRCALEYLSLIHHKEMKRAVPSEQMGTVLELEGIKPTEEERITGVAACKMLTSYFNSELRYDPWESQRHYAMQKRIDKKLEGVIFPCPICN